MSGSHPPRRHARHYPLGNHRVFITEKFPPQTSCMTPGIYLTLMAKPVAFVRALI